MSLTAKQYRHDLFIKGDGSALVFHIPPGQTKKELIPLIKVRVSEPVTMLDINFFVKSKIGLLSVLAYIGF